MVFSQTKAVNRSTAAPDCCLFFFFLFCFCNSAAERPGGKLPLLCHHLGAPQGTVPGSGFYFSLPRFPAVTTYLLMWQFVGPRGVLSRRSQELLWVSPAAGVCLPSVPWRNRKEGIKIWMRGWGGCYSRKDLVNFLTRANHVCLGSGGETASLASSFLSPPCLSHRIISEGMPNGWNPRIIQKEGRKNGKWNFSKTSPEAAALK